MKINLTANNTAEKRILAYLEQNASEALAEKINKGTPLAKDGKPLINRKTLDGFMKYATEEARKIAEKGARFACIDDDTVFGWAIHYFEEEAIEGDLFNLDGTPYKATIKPKAEKKAEPKKAPPKTAPKAEPKTEQMTATILPTLPKPEPTQKNTKNKNTDQISIFELI